MLKKTLQIPIDIEEMLYFQCSALTKEHLDAAAQYVEEQYANEEAQLNFLVGHPKWLEALELAYSEDLKALREARDENNDYEQAAKDYDAGLRELTNKAIAPPPL